MLSTAFVYDNIDIRISLEQEKQTDCSGLLKTHYFGVQYFICWQKRQKNWIYCDASKPSSCQIKNKIKNTKSLILWKIRTGTRKNKTYAITLCLSPFLIHLRSHDVIKNHTFFLMPLWTLCFHNYHLMKHQNTHFHHYWTILCRYEINYLLWPAMTCTMVGSRLFLLLPMSANTQQVKGKILYGTSSKKLSYIATHALKCV